MTAVLSRHAAQRCAEFGIGLDVVTAIATRPDVAWTDTAGERVCTADAHPDWTVVVGSGGVVVTVLRRLRDRWEHDQVSADARPPRADVENVRTGTDTSSGERRRSASTRARTVVASPVVRRVDPEALAAAQHLAGGDLRRLVLQDDGSVVVLNRPRGTR